MREYVDSSEQFAAWLTPGARPTARRLLLLPGAEIAAVTAGGDRAVPKEPHRRPSSARGLGAIHQESRKVAFAPMAYENGRSHGDRPRLGTAP